MLKEEYKKVILKDSLNFSAFTPLIAAYFFVRVGCTQPFKGAILIGLILVIIFMHITLRYALDVKNEKVKVINAEIIDKYERKSTRKRCRIIYKMENGETVNRHMIYRKWYELNVGDKGIVVSNKYTSRFYAIKFLEK